MDRGKYLITAQVIDGSGEVLPMEYSEGIPCDGFVIIAISGDHNNATAFHNISNIDLACAMAQSAELMAGAAIANGILEAQKIERKGKLGDFLDLLNSEE